MTPEQIKSSIAGYITRQFPYMPSHVVGEIRNSITTKSLKSEPLETVLRLFLRVYKNQMGSWPTQESQRNDDYCTLVLTDFINHPSFNTYIAMPEMAAILKSRL